MIAWFYFPWHKISVFFLFSSRSLQLLYIIVQLYGGGFVSSIDHRSVRKAVVTHRSAFIYVILQKKEEKKRIYTRISTSIILIATCIHIKEQFIICCNFFSFIYIFRYYNLPHTNACDLVYTFARPQNCAHSRNLWYKRWKTMWNAHIKKKYEKKINK